MQTRFVLFLVSSLSLVFYSQGQSPIDKSADIKTDMGNELKTNLFNSIDSLFVQIDRGVINPALIDQNGISELSISSFNGLKGYEQDEKNKVNDFYKKTIINLYPISSNEQMITISYLGNTENKNPVLKCTFNLIAKNTGDRFVFSIPLKYYTQNYKTKSIGNITYHYLKELNTKVAREFNKNNTLIAGRFGIKPELLDFYMAEHYQEILFLLGYQYDMTSMGKTRVGYGVDSKTIFSINGNEDFSHDLVHYYAAQVNKKENRNFIAEEGLAYHWGNAYYTDENGDMISLQDLTLSLIAYLKSNTQTALLSLFLDDTNIYNSLAKEVSVRSTLSGLLCKEVEKQKGIQGIQQLINCGKGVDNYFNTLDKLIGINKANFNTEVSKLLNS